MEEKIEELTEVIRDLIDSVVDLRMAILEMPKDKGNKDVVDLLKDIKNELDNIWMKLP